MDDAPIDKEEYDKWRAERVFSQANSLDIYYAAQVRNLSKRPEWKQFMEEVGDQAKQMENHQLARTFQAWNEDRAETRPSWLTDEETGPSDLQDLNEKFPPDDRNEAMGTAPEGNFVMKRRSGGQS